MSAKFLSRAVLICWISSLSVAVAQVRGPADVVVLEQHETSEPLRNIPPLPPQAGQHMKPVYHIPHSLGPAQPDPALQTQAGASAAPATMQNFDGVGNGFSGPGGTFSPDAAPPDTNGAVGDTQYVQWVNESFAVFDKATGAVLYGPAAGNTLFQNMGGHKCQTTNDGDPIVQYDKAAKRWIMTQFAVSGGAPYYQCIAISTTPDATGPYYRYVADQPRSKSLCIRPIADAGGSKRQYAVFSIQQQHWRSLAGRSGRFHSAACGRAQLPGELRVKQPEALEISRRFHKLRKLVGDRTRHGPSGSVFASL